jgi:hypothetical protein
MGYDRWYLTVDADERWCVLLSFFPCYCWEGGTADETIHDGTEDRAARCRHEGRAAPPGISPAPMPNSDGRQRCSSRKGWGGQSSTLATGPRKSRRFSAK